MSTPRRPAPRSSAAPRTATRRDITGSAWPGCIREAALRGFDAGRSALRRAFRPLRGLPGRRGLTFGLGERFTLLSEPSLGRIDFPSVHTGCLLRRSSRLRRPSPFRRNVEERAEADRLDVSGQAPLAQQLRRARVGRGGAQGCRDPLRRCLGRLRPRLLEYGPRLVDELVRELVLSAARLTDVGRLAAKHVPLRFAQRVARANELCDLGRVTSCDLIDRPGSCRRLLEAANLLRV